MRNLSQISINVCLYCWVPKYTRPISHRDSICESCDRKSGHLSSLGLPWETWREQIARETAERVRQTSAGDLSRQAA